MSCGVYKARKNKELVLHAQEEWKLTMKAKKGRLWIRHVRGHSNHPWNDVADKLAGDGNFQRLIYCGPPGARDLGLAPLVGRHS